MARGGQNWVGISAETLKTLCKTPEAAGAGRWSTDSPVSALEMRSRLGCLGTWVLGCLVTDHSEIQCDTDEPAARNIQMSLQAWP